MVSRYISTPTFLVTQTIVGYTTTPNPVLLLVYNGTVYSGGYRIDYGSGNSRFIYPAYDSANNSILICSQGAAVSAALPALTLSNIGVYVIG